MAIDGAGLKALTANASELRSFAADRQASYPPAGKVGLGEQERLSDAAVVPPALPEWVVQAQITRRLRPSCRTKFDGRSPGQGWIRSSRASTLTVT